MTPRQNSIPHIAALGSMTAALKARRVLAAAGIPSSVVALSPSDTKYGCAYGVSFAHPADTVRAVLRAAKIPVSQWIAKDGEAL